MRTNIYGAGCRYIENVFSRLLHKSLPQPTQLVAAMYYIMAPGLLKSYLGKPPIFFFRCRQVCPSVRKCKSVTRVHSHTMAQRWSDNNMLTVVCWLLPLITVGTRDKGQGWMIADKKPSCEIFLLMDSRQLSV